eukprot:3270393-Prorocentrum_lima.AAC.1
MERSEWRKKVCRFCSLSGLRLWLSGQLRYCTLAVGWRRVPSAKRTARDDNDDHHQHHHPTHV